MQSFFQVIIRYRIAVLILAALWAVTGSWIAFQTPIDAVPDLSENQVLVYAACPGWNPPEIELQVTRPLSHGLQGVPGVRTIRGSSDVGFSLLHLIFDDRVTFVEARRRVQEQLKSSAIVLPAGIFPQLTAEGIPTGQIFWYTVEGTDTDLVQLRRIQDQVVAPRLQAVPGVAEVASVGGFLEECHLQVDLSRLRESGITLAEFSEALRSAIADYDLAALSRHEWESLVLPQNDGRKIALKDVASFEPGVAPRRGVFEKDGSEMVAGVVHLQYGKNPLEVTRAVRSKLREISSELPANIQLVPCYDRTPLIVGAIGTVSRTLIESILITTVCIFVVLRHWRTSLIITLSLPLAILGAFLGMRALHLLEVADIQTNIMSLAGIVVSIGVLVDSSIVVAENVTHELRRKFGDQPVAGDVSGIIAEACATVARPAFFAVLMMIVSFLPIFLLEGIDGRMYRPLAWTKTLALLSVAILTVTVIPALCSYLIRGRLQDESASWVVRSVVSVYRPVMNYLLDHPWPLAMMLVATLVLAAAATGMEQLVGGTVALGIALIWWLAKSVRARWIGIGLLVAGALASQHTMRPINQALRFPLDEGMVMDMPITIPRVSVTQALDDLKARNMVLCRFPEVHMVTGKAGRAETPFDPAPVDMIESMVEFRRRSWWPARRLRDADARHEAQRVVDRLIAAQLVDPPADIPALVKEITEQSLLKFDAIQRETSWQFLRLLQEDLSRDLSQELVSTVVKRWTAVANLSTPPKFDAVQIAEDLGTADRARLGQMPEFLTIDSLLTAILMALNSADQPRKIEADELLSTSARLENRWRRWSNQTPFGLADDLLPQLRRSHDLRWRDAVTNLNSQLRHRAPSTWTYLVAGEVFTRLPITDPDLTEKWKQILAARYGTLRPQSHHGIGHVGLPPTTELPIIDPHPVFDALVEECSAEFAKSVWLWPHEVESLTRIDGELDRSVQMPGWANVWTRPIQNRVDMLATGVNSEIGIRVLGQDFDRVVEASESVAEFMRTVPGAANVVADPIRGKSYHRVSPVPGALQKAGLSEEQLQKVVRTATDGSLIGVLQRDGDSLPVRVLLRGGNLSIDQLAPIELGRLPDGRRIPLGEVAQMSHADGPATIKSENGWLRNYVRLNVSGGSATEFVEMAQRELAQQVHLPEGVFLEWTGQYEHAVRTRRSMLWLIPFVMGLIVAILYWTFRDWADTGLMLLAVPGALAGGIICQWALGYPYTMAVGVGYIACFGMAAATSMVMLVYLREAIARAGGIERISLPELRAAVMAGAVHRLRPKLLTEATTILSLAPMLWSAGVGADVIRPMAAPVLGGILIADEVVDLLLPVAFYAVRRRRWQSRQPATHLPSTTEA